MMVSLEPGSLGSCLWQGKCGVLGKESVLSKQQSSTRCTPVLKLSTLMALLYYSMLPAEAQLPIVS